jgi:acyl carrier protein
MQNLSAAMRAVFPTLTNDLLTSEFRLSDCPNWDSMTAVNLLMEVENACGISLEGYEPSDTTTLGDLAAKVAAAGGKP